jgi:hypothetical protein
MDAPPALLNLHDNTRSRRDRPCSSCRRRKSRCVLPPDADACVLCTFHKQTCIFGDEASPQPRKRKRTLEQTSGDAGGSSTSKGVIPATRQQHQPPQSVSSSSAITITEEYEPFQTSVLLRTTLGLQHHHYTEYIGPTTIFEPCLYGNAKDKNTSSRNGVLRNVAPSITFSVKADQETQNYGHDIEALDAIEEIVAPHGKALIDIYFRIVHPSFPILDKAVFLEKYARSHREFSPPCLGGVYILASTWWSYSAELSNIPVPDVKALVTLASKSLSDIVHRPKLSSIQGFLLLSQHDGGESWDRTAQMIAISQILGLHLDCSDWDIPEWEKGLRKRLSWAIYMQDIWSALKHGWPAKISDDNWLVPSIMEKDFEEREAGEAEDEQVSSEIDQGRMVFTQMITLSNIVSGLLKVFYTLRAVKDLSQHPNAAQVVLERAKPIQLKLKEWYVSLPEELRMDNTKDQRLSSTSESCCRYDPTKTAILTYHRLPASCILCSRDYASSVYHTLARHQSHARRVDARPHLP